MNALLTREIPLPHPAWLAPLLLPAVPMLAASLHDEGGLKDQTVTLAVLLLLLGVGLAAGVPLMMASAGWHWLKEAEQLRPAWLAALFLAPAPLLFGGGDAAQTALMFFVATCALVAAVSLGAEFQHRTLGGLLSQPVERQDLWRIKTAVLAAALLTHAAAFTLALGLAGAQPSPAWLAMVPLAVAVALGTTPWWTLRTRSLIAGLVFSLAAPLVTLALLALAVDLAFAVEELTAAMLFEDRAFRGALWVAAPVYALACARLGFRRWLEFEAIETEGATVAGLLPRRKAGRSAARRLPAWLQLSGKELRLQAVTWGVCGFMVLLALVTLARDWNPGTRDALVIFTAMLAALAVLLAGATCIAEERRLGTLDGQLLQPVSRARQWWLKLIVAALPALLAVVAAFALVGGVRWLQIEPLAAPNLLFVVALASGGFVAAVLASSASANALRALIAGLMIFLAGATVVGVTAAIVQWTQNKLRLEPLAAIYETGRLADGTDLFEQAAALTAAELEKLRPTAGVLLHQPWFWAGLGATVWLAVLAVALLFAWRNFARPAGAAGRLLRQGALAVGVLAVGAGSFSVWGHGLGVAGDQRNLLLEAHGHLKWQQELSPAQRELYRLKAAGRLFREVRLVMIPPLATGNAPPARLPKMRADGSRSFSLPLKPADLAFILESAELPHDLREALRREAGQQR